MGVSDAEWHAKTSVKYIDLSASPEPKVKPPSQFEAHGDPTLLASLAAFDINYRRGQMLPIVWGLVAFCSMISAVLLSATWSGQE